MGQLALLGSRRFGGFFWTQFLGAYNDNVFRSAVVTLITYEKWSLWGMSFEQLVPLAFGLFVAPFFLFSGSAGELADRYPKATLVRITKLLEISVMCLAFWGFARGSVEGLLAVLFLMGLHSTLFGPLKFSILPQLTEPDGLVGANALIETGTMLAILLGNLSGIALVSLGPAFAGGFSVAIASAGYLSSLAIPAVPAENRALRISRNPWTPTLQMYRLTRSSRAVFLSVLGVSWFWLYGSALMSLVPSYASTVLHGDRAVYALFPALFSVGIGFGSLLCERLSERKLELGLVPFGSIGMTVFALDLFWVGQPFPEGRALMGLVEFVASPGAVRILLDLTLLSAFAGFYLIPLQTMIQQRSDPACRSRVIAGSNILGALFMVISSVVVAALLSLRLSIPTIIGVLALLNAAVAFYIYRVIPEFLYRFVAWIIAHVMYRLRTVNRERIPLDGAALLVCNHVTFIDWLIIASASKRPVRFVMYHAYLALPGLGFVFRDAKVIPIAPAREDVERLEEAYDRIAAELEAGELVCIFPEGKITTDGRMNPFRRGIENIVRRTPVPVVPMALKGLWGSFFSRKGGRALRRPFRRFWSRVELVVGQAVAPKEVSANELALRVAALAGCAPPAPAGEGANR